MVTEAGTTSRLCYTVGETVVFPALHQLPGVARVAPPRMSRRSETRYDTPNGALGRHGIRLGAVTDDHGLRWYRTPPAEESGEAAAPAVAGTEAGGEQVPPALLEHLQGIVRGRELLPVGTVLIQSAAYDLADGAGLAAGTVTDETRSVLLPGAEAGLPAVRIWCADGLSGTAMEAAGALFEKAGGVPAGPGGVPDTEPGMPAPARGEPETPAADGPVGMLLVQYLRGQYRELLHHEPRVRRNDADGVHKMRVATRRLRSALSSYRSTMQPEPARSLRGELRWLAGILGDARDAHVMRHRLKELIAGEPGDLVMGPVSARVDEELLHDYRQAYARILEVLNSERYFRLLDGVEALVDGPPWADSADRPAGPAAAAMIRRDRKRLRRRVRETHGLAGEEHAEALHEARKDAKKLRYAAEVWAAVQPVEAKVMVDAAEHLQKILGEHQDSVVTRQYLRRMGASATAAGENGFTYGRLHALEQANAAAARERFAHAWQGFPSGP